MRKNPGKLSKLILPILFTSIGAGMIMPFMNVFFRNVHNLSDASIGVLFAWGSLAMGIGLLCASISGKIWQDPGCGRNARSLHSLLSLVGFCTLVWRGSHGLLFSLGADEHELARLYDFYDGTSRTRIARYGGEPIQHGK